jgi:hypothetical protein
MLHYQIEFDDYRQHLIHVTLRFLANPNQELWLPTWIPGSYLIREFSKHIESVKASDEAGRLLKLKKRKKIAGVYLIPIMSLLLLNMMSTHMIYPYVVLMLIKHDYM